jgi:predicted DNA-binding antitoxin AbrB/MazE fold protein
VGVRGIIPSEEEAMSAIPVVFRNGVLQPKVPLALKEGEEIDVFILPHTRRVAPESNESSPGQRAAAILARIAAMKIEAGPVETTSRDHDRYIYTLPGDK